MEPIRILHIITDSNIGGAGRQLLYLIGASDRERFRFAVLVPEGSRLCAPLRAAGADVREIQGLTASRSPGALRPLTEAIRRLQPDIVHTHSSLTGQKAARAAGVRCRMLTKHCSDLPQGLSALWAARMWARLTYFGGIRAAIATDEVSAAVLAYEGMPRRRISVVPNGCPQLPCPEKAASDALRRSLGIPEGKFTVGYFGRMEHAKGPDILLQAAALCRRFTEDVHFLFCGDGSLAQELRSLAVRYGIEDTVTFAGFAEDIPLYMSLCRVIVSPSRGTETTSLSLCEGMSLGLVPVAADVGGSAALIGDSGITVPPEDPPALYRALMELARDPDLTALYSRKAQQRYRERATAERMAAGTAQVWRTLAESLGKWQDN